MNGIWLHTTLFKGEVLSEGWCPECIQNTMFGTAIYLSRERWHEAGDVIRCGLDVEPTEVEDLRGDSPEVYRAALPTGLGRLPGAGTEPQNRQIRDFWLSRGTKVVVFTEPAELFVTHTVAAVFDPTIIVVLE